MQNRDQARRKAERIYMWVYAILSGMAFWGMPGILRVYAPPPYLLLPILLVLLMIPITVMLRGHGIGAIGWATFIIMVAANLLLSYAHGLSENHDSQAGFWWIAGGFCLVLALATTVALLVRAWRRDRESIK